MVEDAISIEGDLFAGFNSVGVWGSSAGAIVASEVGFIYVYDLNQDVCTQTAGAQPGE